MEEENRVLRHNLLALKRLLLEQRAETDGAAPPARQRPRGSATPAPAPETEAEAECARLRVALEHAFRECAAAAAERDAWRARCEAQTRAVAQRDAELQALRGVAAESELAQRAAARAQRHARDLERRVHAQLGDARGALRRARQLAATNATLLAYLQAVLGVDSVARFLAAHAHTDDDDAAALAHARRLAHTETLARLHGLPALCADAAASLRADHTPPPKHRQRNQEQPEQEHQDQEGQQGQEQEQQQKEEGEDDDFRVAQEMVGLLASGDADAGELAHNAATRGVAVGAVCAALCVWMAAWPLAPGALETALAVAFRRAAGPRLRTRAHRTATAFVRALAQESPSYAAVGHELCAQLAAQTVGDAAACDAGRARTAQSLAHTLAALACDLALGTAPIYAATADVLARRAPAGVAVVCAAAAGWPEAFVPRPHDLFMHALPCAVCTLDSDSSTCGLLARVRDTCHWRPESPEVLARVLAHPRAVLRQAQERQQEWVCAVCVLAACVPGFADTLAGAAAMHGEEHRALVRRVCAAAGFPG